MGVPQDEDRAMQTTLLAGPPRVINVGLELFAENIASQGGKVVHVRWSPPAGGDPRLASLLGKLQG
jgi:FdrA protein